MHIVRNQTFPPSPWGFHYVSTMQENCYKGIYIYILNGYKTVKRRSKNQLIHNFNLVRKNSASIRNYKVILKQQSSQLQIDIVA